MKLNDVDLNKMRVFAVVARAGGVGNAAKHLSVTPSAVSQALSSLELALGAELFERTARRLILTATGEELLQAYQRYEAELESTLERLQGEPGALRGLLRIGIFLGFFRREFTSAVARLLSDHAGISVKYVYAAPSEFDELLREHKLDVALTFTPPRDHTDLVAAPLWEQELVLVAAPRFALVDPELASLASLPLVDYYSSPVLFDRWSTHHFGQVSKERSIRAFAASAPALLELAAEGVGIGIAPRDLAEPYLEDGRLVEIPGPRAALRDQIWLLELKRRAANPRLSLLREYLQSGPREPSALNAAPADLRNSTPQ